MVKENTIKINPEHIEDPNYLKAKISRDLKIPESRIRHIEIIRKSIDARKKNPHYVLKTQSWIDEEFQAPTLKIPNLIQVGGKREIHIIGMGPAGLFAALQAIESGFKPIIIERGKEVRERRRDLAPLMREGKLNTESNYCFGEGGAGTFSDGKLYTRSRKRGSIQQILDYLVYFGAPKEILIDAHPHIGTNKLPAIIQNIREAIIEAGGEVWFEHKLTDIEISPSGKLKSIILNGDLRVESKAMILATGHSARDIYVLLKRKEIKLESKPFALGVRIEHPQTLIDQIQYHCGPQRPNGLPSAAYSWVQQAEGTGVFSFCMCPGGIICPASTQQGQLVVNGWSPSKRNSDFANSGIVAEVKPGVDFQDGNPLSGLDWQAEVEKKAFQSGGGKFRAPAQRLTDFLNGRTSPSLPDCSYHPGLTSSDLREILPEKTWQALREGLKLTGKRMKGYITEEAVMVGVESRTSSPVRIVRGKEDFMHPDLEGLFPCGEGAGFAGGIMSAAIDGQKVAKAVTEFLRIP